MIIETLELENFKSYKNSTIKFKQGISLILGENGSGKSSILEAISFVLFGKLNTNLDDAIRKPISEDDEVKQMSVTLTFKHQGKKYRIKRQRKNKTTVILHDISGEKPFTMSKTTESVNNDIKNILNIDYDAFQNAVYIKQGEITKLTDSKPAEKKKLISKLLNIESLEKAYDNIREVILTYENKKTYNQGKLQSYDEKLDEKKQTQQKIEQLQKEKEELKKQLKQTIKELEDYQKEKQLQQSQKSEYQLITNEIENKQKEYQRLNNEINNIKTSLEEIESDEKQIKQIETKIQQLPELIQAKDAHEKSNTIQYTKLNPINQRINEINKHKQTLTNTKEDYEKYNKLINTEKQLQTTRDKLNEDVNQNTIIKTQIENIKQIYEKRGEELKECTKQAVNIFHIGFKSMLEIKEHIQKQRKLQEDKIDTLNKQKQQNNSKIETNKNMIQSTNKSLEDLINTTDTCPICQSEITHKKHVQLEEQYKNKIQQYKQENLILTKEIQEIDINLVQLQKSYDELFKINVDSIDEKQEEYNNLKSEYKQRSEKEYPKIQQKQDEYIKCKEDLKIIQTQIDKLQQNYESYKVSENYLKTAGNLEQLVAEKQKYETQQKKYIQQARQLMLKNNIKDNLNHHIQYLEKLKEEQNTLKGKVMNKEDKQKQLENRKEQLQTTTHNMSELNIKLQKLSYDEVKYDAITKIYDETLKLYNYTKEQLSANERETEIMKDTLVKISKELENLNIIKDETQNIIDFIKLLEIIRETYSKDGVQSDLREEVKPQIEHNTMNIFQEFGFNYSSINLDRDYNITVKSHGEELNLNQLSGGERIVIALALRLAIAKTISQSSMELLILDEPTIHLDYERRSSLLEIISKINLVPQMLVVTHDDEMEALSNNIIKVNKQNAISHIEN